MYSQNSLSIFILCGSNLSGSRLHIGMIAVHPPLASEGQIATLKLVHVHSYLDLREPSW